MPEVDILTERSIRLNGPFLTDALGQRPANTFCVPLDVADAEFLHRPNPEVTVGELTLFAMGVVEGKGPKMAKFAAELIDGVVENKVTGLDVLLVGSLFYLVVPTYWHLDTKAAA